jgi:2-dehydro-3-deoxyphosphooctonate aldolase (KDO 8-P synthase)
MVCAEMKVGHGDVWITERGTSFGSQLIVDFAGMGRRGVIYDATHSVPNRDFALPMARTALVAGASGIFMEVHDAPHVAECDGDKQVDLADFENILTELTNLWDFTHNRLPHLS